jgi:hypothetical protein
MTNASPIRRYILLRHRDHSSPVPRWSMERIAAAPREESPAPSTAPHLCPPGARE